ncbi:MAG: hypothetical protein JO219_01665 [Candidatus Eremiobacteraeota bacterium]|nr:hypothetical protein [Candidatus Eremiobacteraeota bacterium]MBV8366574.1 hypothetical protein [Candidatus Eremiobacteraeota bacterium]
MNVEVERALADLTEVRDRLASVQRFRGYSSRVAAVSGAIALAGGLVQAQIVPHPSSAADVHVYVAIWLSCFAAALAIYYGNLLGWYLRNRGHRARYQSKTVSVSLLPALALGAVLSAAVYLQGVPAMLPGIWYTCYGLGLFASRNHVPRGVLTVAAMFGIIGAALLLMPNQWPALAWWVMSAGFAVGQFWIGWLIAAEGRTEGTTTIPETSA